jgi:hypothetical protein
MVKIDYAPPIIMACCVLHKYFQLMGMDALGYDYVENMHDKKDIGASKCYCIPSYYEGDVAKVAKE